MASFTDTKSLRRGPDENLVRSIDKRWNRLWPDIVRLVQGLERLGLEYHNGEVTYGGPKEKQNA